MRCSAKRSAYSDSSSEASHSLTDGIALGVPSHKVVHASTQPIEIGTGGHAGECRAVKLARSGFRKCSCGLLRPFDAAGAGDNLVKPLYFARQPTFSRPRQEAGHPRPVRVTGLVE